MFDPASLSGKLLWLRAKDLGSSGSPVLTWPDQSGLGNDAQYMSTAPLVAGASTPLGGKSVRFGGASGFSFATLRGIPISAATASTSYSASHQASNVFDGVPEVGDNGNLWASTSMPAWVRLQPTTATAVTSYAITSRTGANINQSPRDWTFEGSNDGTAWTILDTRTGETPASGESRIYSFSNSTAYTYYRINITATGGASIAAIAEMALNPVAGYGTSSPPLTATNTAAEIWVVVKSDTGGQRGMWSWGQDTGGSSDSFYAYSNSRVYESFGLTNGNRQDFLPTELTSDWQVYRVRNDGTLWEAWISGFTQHAAAAKPFGYSTFPVIGRTKAGGLGAFFTGNIAEIFLRDTISTTQESADLFNYFLSEHISATGVSSARAASVYLEAPALGSIAAQTESVYLETAMLVEPTQVSTVYAESLLTTTPAIQIETTYTEILLLPDAITRFKGWGVPL